MRKIALALSLVMSFTIPWEGMVRIPGLGTGSKVVGFLLAAFWLASILITGRFRRPGTFQIAVLLFVLWNAVSVFWSANPYGSVAHLMTWIQLLMFVFVWWDLYTTRTAVLAGLQAYILGAYVAIGAAFANDFAGNAFYSHYNRYSPGQTNPDGFGFILALGIPVAWYLATSKITGKMSYVLKSVNYIYVPAALFGIVLSGTRTALIASIVGMAFGLALLSRLRPLARIAIFLLFISVIFILLPNVGALESFQRFGTIPTEITQGTLHERTNIWREGLATFAEHPFIGIGSNMFTTVTTSGKAAHNSFLSILVELGLVGLLLFGFIIAIVVARALGRPKWESWFWIALLAVWTIGASTLTWEDRKSTWLFLSLAIASAALARDREEVVPLVERSEPELTSVSPA
jgi:exopolysaccharide production protein ExoQ